MKFSLKIAVTVCLLTLCLSFAGVFGQASILSSVTSPTTLNLNSVFVVNNVTSTTTDLTQLNAWAVGDNGTVVFWNGNTWSSLNTSSTANIYSVFFTNSTNGWAVGGNSTNGLIWYYNGTWNLWNKVSFSGNPSGTDCHQRHPILSYHGSHGNDRLGCRS